jgi:hypothetical protein
MCGGVSLTGDTEMADVTGFRKYWTEKMASLKSECHAIMSKYPEEASIQQVCKLVFLGFGTVSIT